MVMNDYSSLELSTQHLIEAALRRGIQVDVLDAGDNIIRLSKDGIVEIVMQATRTSKDTYIAPLIMTNKHVTKLLLEEAGICVPSGYRVASVEEGLGCFETIRHKAMVVKPVSTNFGVGITMLDADFSRLVYEKALNTAFAEDATVLVEAFAEGEEYRFLVIEDRVVGVLRRVPANVVGDGVHSITELVEIKNRDPLRGTKYRKPLEKIKLGDFERTYLTEQGLTVADVLPEGMTVYLRKNSNISTGGDSLDYTDLMYPGYFDMAIKAAKTVKAKVCGVDMIVKDIDHFDDQGYCIIELNFNPAIHIHNAPYKGKNRQADEAVLNLLGF
jgi:glutamate--cysteine ligase